MYTEHDERKGLVKTTWQKMRNRVRQVEPQFAEIVDALNPDDSFALYLAYYPYGAMDADAKSTLLPTQNGNYYRLTDNDVPADIQTHLGYSANNTPFGMVLEKQIESFINLKKQSVSIPWQIYTPGKMFPLTRILPMHSKRVYSPNGLLSSVAGSRCAFMLPNIGSAVNHVNLQREFNVRKQTPKTLYEHFDIFKEIVSCEDTKPDWRCCVMYFSEQWIIKIINDDAWACLKKYLHEVAWHQFEYDINRVNYENIFSIVQMNRNLKPNPYLTDTAKHLFETAIGSAPGYAPAIDESAMPLNLLLTAFSEVYGLKKYTPTIMQPVYFNYNQDQYPVYYSLQNPSTHVFSPKSRETSSTIFEMRELEYIMGVFADEISRTNSMCSGTLMELAAREVKFDYFHNKVDTHGIVNHSSAIEKADDRFLSKFNLKQKEFASDSPFFRGCISMAARNQAVHSFGNQVVS
jgi:hypothetical protein